MQSNEMLVGSDMELMPRSIVEGQHDKVWWKEWMSILERLPPKGERRILEQDFWLHRDGLSVEYGIPPVKTLREFRGALRHGKRLVELSIGERLTAVDWFDTAVMANDPELAQFLEMGCSPDLVCTPPPEDGNLVQFHERTIPTGARLATTRECGGHIHISLPPTLMNSRVAQVHFVDELDELVYPLVSMHLSDYRSWYRHRKLFRFTEYGIEYRSLGASALLAKDAEKYLKLVFQHTKQAWEYGT